MKDPWTGTARVSLRCSEDMRTMLIAAARYEHRSESQIMRLALAHYFTEQGYFDPENISKLATAK